MAPRIEREIKSSSVHMLLLRTRHHAISKISCNFNIFYNDMIKASVI